MSKLDTRIERLNKERNTINAELRRVKAEQESLEKAKEQVVTALNQAKKEKEEAEAVTPAYMMLTEYDKVGTTNNYKEKRKEVKAIFMDALGNTQRAIIHLPIQSEVNDETVKPGMYRVNNKVATSVTGGF